MNSGTTIDVCPSIGTADFVNSLRSAPCAVSVSICCIAVSVCTVEGTIPTRTPIGIGI